MRSWRRNRSSFADIRTSEYGAAQKVQLQAKLGNQDSPPSEEVSFWKLRAQDERGLVPGVGQAVNVELALQAMNITKQFSRDLLGRSLPVPDATLAVHQKALAAIAAKARQTRLQVRIQQCPTPYCFAGDCP